MSHIFNVRLQAQAISSKLYDFASENSYSTVTERYKDFYSALTRSLQRGILVENTVKSEDDFHSTAFDAIDDYSLETLFYELPRVLKASSDKYISPQVFEKFGFKETNSHPLKLLNLKSDASEVRASDLVTNPSKNTDPVPEDTDDSGDCSNELQGK